MESKATVILALATALLLTASLAVAEMVKDFDGIRSPPPMSQVGPMGVNGMGNTVIPPEKLEAIRIIQSHYEEGLFNLRQDIRAKQVELNSIMLKSQPDTATAKNTFREIAALQIKEADTLIDMHARISTETDVRLPMPHMGQGGA
jgi:Spy/CpxP family protein refolding chaperone